MIGPALLMLFSPAPAAADHDAAGSVAVRIEIDSAADVATLHDLGVDIWTERPGPGAVLAAVSPTVWPALAASDFAVEVVDPDLGPAVQAERLRVQTDPVADHTDAFFDDYRDLDELNAHVDVLADARPDLATTLELGSSVEGRPIRAIEISDAAADAPVILLNAGQHAREWISMATAVCIADELVTRADEPEVASLLSQLRFAIVPVVNPDGYVYTWEEDRYWRKNRRDAHGVDTNRNFAVAWGGPGSNNNPAAGNYRGEAEFSEPEAAAVRDLALGYDTLRSHIDIHAYGQLVLYPWGFVDEPAPADDVLNPLATQMASTLSDEHGETYVPLMGAQFYPASGNASDWFYGELGAYSFTYELRPREAEPHQEGFVLPPDQIRPVCREAMAAIGVLAEFTISAEPGVPGDDGNADTDGWGSTGTGSRGTGDDSTSEGPTPEGTAGPTGSPTGGGTSAPDETSSGATPGVTGVNEPADGASADSDGCGCRSGPGRSRWFALLPLLAFGPRRRSPHARR